MLNRYPHLHVLKEKVEPILRFNIRQRLPDFNMSSVQLTNWQRKTLDQIKQGKSVQSVEQIQEKLLKNIVEQE